LNAPPNIGFLVDAPRQAEGRPEKRFPCGGPQPRLFLRALFGCCCVQNLLVDIIEGIMARVGEFCPSNIARLVLGVVIVVTLVVAVGVWLFHSPGHGASIEQPTRTAEPLK
jgi:hypothetical protein